MAKKVTHEEFRFDYIINGDDSQKELYDLGQQTAKLTRENKDLAREKAKLVAAGKKESAEYKKLDAAMKENNKSIREKNARMDALRRSIGITNLSFKELRNESRKLSNELNSRSDFGSVKYKQLEERLKAINARMAQLRGNTRASESSLTRWANGFNKYAALGASFVAVLTGVVFKIQEMIDFSGKLSDAQSNVQKTTGLSAASVSDLAKNLGALNTRTSRLELLKLAEEAGRLGKTGVEDVYNFVKVANQLKVALGDDISEEQIREVGKMVTIYKVGEREGKNFEQSMLALGSSINEVSASGANQASFLVDFIKRTAGISDVAKISAQDMVGLAAAFDEVGQSQEISATAINKFFGSAAADVQKFADVANVSIQEYSRMLEEDANEALILFLKGLKEGNPTLEEMEVRLKGIELGGTRGKQAIGALAANIENLQSKQDIANRSLKEATSLTNEYNLKNNNLAAVIEKIGRKIRGAFAAGPINKFITALVTGIGKLLGVVQSVDDAFAKETKTIYENAKANRRLASESQTLLDRYEELTADGIEPTTESKIELDKITLQLKDRLGESVMAIDEETGAYILNTQAVRDQIKIKRLSADEEASTLASRLVGSQERLKELRKEYEVILKEKKLRDQIFADQNKGKDFERTIDSGVKNLRSGADVTNLPGFKEANAAREKMYEIGGLINRQLEQEADLIEKLAELNFTAEDAREFLVPDVNEQATIQEGAKKTVGGATYSYKNGKWVLDVIVRPTGDPDGPKRVQDYLKLLSEQRRALELEAAGAIKDKFTREMELERINNKHQIEELKSHLIDVKSLKGADQENAIAINKNINDRIEIQNATHQERITTILGISITDRQQQLQAGLDRDLELLKTAQLKEIAAFQGSKSDRDALLERHRQEELQVQTKFALQMKKLLEQALSMSSLDGVDLSILSEEDKQKVIDRINELKLKLAELGLAKSSIAGSGQITDDLGAAQGALAGVDIFGFTVDDWESSFDNIDTAIGKINLIQMGLSGLGSVWNDVSKLMSAQENNELEQFTRNQDRRRQVLDTRLDRGYINQRQYNKAVEELEREQAKKEAELRYKQAKREKITAMSTIITQGAVAVARAIAASPKTLGLPWSAIIAGKTALNLGLAAATPLPAKGFEKGLYPMMREQDKKIFDVQFGGYGSTQLVTSPTHFKTGNGSDFIAGENSSITRPELIIDSDAYSKFDPGFKQVLNRQIRAVKGYQNGMYNEDTTAPVSFDGSSSSTDPEMKTLLMDVRSLLAHLASNGVAAYMDKDLRNMQRLQEELDRFNKFNNNKRV